MTNKPNPALNMLFSFFMIMTIMTLLVFGMVQMCNAQYDEQTALALVQCLRAECETCDRDPREKAAIAWVLKKKAESRGISLYEQTRGYCAVFNRHHDRAIAITDSTFESPKLGPKQWWLEMRIWARLFLIGDIPDPTPKARHWGSNRDTYRMKGRVLLRSFCNTSKTLCNHVWGAKLCQE